MGKQSNGSDTVPCVRTLKDQVHAIYSADNKAVADELTNLLVAALRNGDSDSQSRLRRFFDLRLVPVTDLDGRELDYDLLGRAALFMNGENANRVQTWISSYKASADNSDRRSLHETILRNFVSSRTAVEEMKLQLVESRTLRADAGSKCDVLREMIKSISGRAEKLACNCRIVNNCWTSTAAVDVKTRVRAITST